MDGEKSFEGSRRKRTRTESGRVTSKAANVYYCFIAGVTEVAIFPDPQNFKEAMKHLDAILYGLMLSDLSYCCWLVWRSFTNQCCYLKNSGDYNASDIHEEERTANGEIEHYKARLAWQGYLKTLGLDFFDTYLPVAELTSSRVIYAQCLLV